MNTVADGRKSHSSIRYRLAVQEPDTVQGSVAFFLFTVHCSLLTEYGNSIARSDLAFQNGNWKRQREVATRNGKKKKSR